MRVKTGTVRRQHHKKVFGQTKGFRMTKNRLYKVAQEALVHAGQYAYVGRKNRKRNFRKLWITRLNAALTPYNLSYSRLIKGLNDSQIELDRKILATIALNDPKTFQKIVEKIKS